MERYDSSHDGDCSSHSYAKLPGTCTARNNSSNPVCPSPVIEEHDTGSECSDIGAARPPHDLTIPMQTFRHYEHYEREEDNAATSESSRKLLPDLDSALDAPQAGDGSLGKPGVPSVAESKKSLSLLRRLPWMVFLSFLGSLTCTALSVCVLIVSDQTAQTSWSIQPSVYLAVLAPLGNILLRYCLSQGLINDWWNLASRRTTLEALHNRWEHGTSLKSAATSFSTFDRISAAKILIAATFAVNPLLQRALRPYNQKTTSYVTVPFQLATAESSSKDVDFRSDSIGMFSSTGQLGQPMIRVMRDYTNRAAIINEHGACPGNCTGTVRAAGLASNCSTTRVPIQMDHQKLPIVPVTVFSIGAGVPSVQEGEPSSLTFSAFYVQTQRSNDTSLTEMPQSCDGSATTVTCIMTPATMDYSVVLRNNTISVDVSAVKVAQTKSNDKPDSTHVTNYTYALYGLSFVANSIVQSNMNATANPEGWSYWLTGPLSYFHTNIKQDSHEISCEITSTDPTDDILTTFNEIMFRVSMVALSNSTNSSLATEYTMTASELVIVYESRYIYLAAATFISLLACCSVLPIFNGFWRLNRPFSLSPIEIAQAFDAPLLRLSGAGTSDLPVDQLVKRVGTTGVQYVTIANTDREYTELRQRKFVVARVAILRLNDDNNAIPPTPTQINFIKTYSQLINSVLPPRNAAEGVQHMVKALSDQGTIKGYTYGIGLLRRGWFMLSSQQSLVKLAAFTVETAKLPETIEVIDGEQWPPLLELKRALIDGLQGLELYIPTDSSVNPAAAIQVAERQWANINTLRAMILCRDPT
ncbi:hypothetical protein KCU67_g1558, partial [Aureobasidium melanogenum]